MSQKLEESEEKFIQKYLRFCANPLRGEQELRQEYEILKGHPRVRHLAFHHPEVLMVGTDPVIITHRGLRFIIGEFIIFLTRKQVAGYWEVDFCFMNVTSPIIVRSYDFDQMPRSVLIKMHPHISALSADSKLIKDEVGKLCISRGQFPVYQYLRQARIHLAAPRLIEILEVYPTGTPYTDVENWPVLEIDDV